MSHGLQTRKLLGEDAYEPQSSPNPFVHEYCWSDVAGGLNRVLLGYLLTILSAVLIAVLTVLVIVYAGRQLMSGGKLHFGVWWLLFGGIGLVTVLSAMSYWLILAGQIRCAIYTPDRCGARWMIFTCILCLVVGPAMNMTASFLIKPDQEKMLALQEKFRDPNFDFDRNKQEILSDLFGPQILLNIVGTITALIASIFFVLYFRAIGVCFEDKRLIGMAELYLIYSCVLSGISIFFLYTAITDKLQPLMAAAVGVGWLINLGWYLFLLFFTSCVIASNCRNLQRSPLQGF